MVYAAADALTFIENLSSRLLGGHCQDWPTTNVAEHEPDSQLFERRDSVSALSR